MSEMYNNDEESLRGRVEVLVSEPEFIEAVRDTWSFMTGEEMPDEVLEMARSRALNNPNSPDLWQLKFLYQYTDPALQTPLGKLFLTSRQKMIDTDEVVPESRMPTQDPFNRELISLLGEQILNTAYKACGGDIEEVIEATKTSLLETDDPFVATTVVCDALAPIIAALHAQDEAGKEREQLLKDDKGHQINHIVKLSPLTVTVDSDQRFVPSCLSISIILASLLKKIGVEDVLHAGVLAQSGAYLAHSSLTMASEVTMWADAHGINVGDPLRHILEDVKRESYRTAVDFDPHSTVLFKLKGRWTVLDPYTDRIMYEGEKISQHADLIADLVNHNKGLQVVNFYDHDVTELVESETISTVFEIIMENLPTKARWQKALDTAIVYNDWRVLMQVFTVNKFNMSLDYFDLLGISSLFDNIVAANVELGEKEDAKFEALKIEYAERFLTRSLAQQVFGLKKINGDEFREALARCDNDPNNYRNRVEDLYLWPITAYMRALQQLRKHFEGEFKPAPYTYPHNSMEVGEATHRIGFCSLLDVSYGLGNKLPLSLWTSMATSQLPFLYAKQTESIGDNEKVLADRLGHLISRDLSRYRQFSVII
jgi:hypothetical protein